jgi:hypothetical protein
VYSMATSHELCHAVGGYAARSLRFSFIGEGIAAGEAG